MYTFTGQYSYASDFGLLYYNAHWYDPALSRFAQADSIVPAGVQGYDRYAYVNNSPVNYVDPSGHTWTCTGANDDHCSDNGDSHPSGMVHHADEEDDGTPSLADSFSGINDDDWGNHETCNLEPTYLCLLPEYERDSIESGNFSSVTETWTMLAPQYLILAYISAYVVPVAIALAVPAELVGLVTFGVVSTEGLSFAVESPPGSLVGDVSVTVNHHGNKQTLGLYTSTRTVVNSYSLREGNNGWEIVASGSYSYVTNP